MEAMESLHFPMHNGVIERLFDDFDANKDGLLTWDEVWAPLENIQKKLESK